MNFIFLWNLQCRTWGLIFGTMLGILKWIYHYNAQIMMKKMFTEIWDPRCSIYSCSHAKFLRSCPTLCTSWTMAHQAPLSLGFSRQEYWSGLPCAPPGDLPDPVIKLRFLMSPALAGRVFRPSTTLETCYNLCFEQ